MGETSHQDSKFQFLWKDWNMWLLRAPIPLGLGLGSSWRAALQVTMVPPPPMNLHPTCPTQGRSLSDPHRHRLVPCCSSITWPGNQSVREDVPPFMSSPAQGHILYSEVVPGCLLGHRPQTLEKHLLRQVPVTDIIY